MTSILHTNEIQTFLHGYLEFKEKVRNGYLGKTAQYWLSYMDHVQIVLNLMKAVKSNDFFLYAQCLHEMPDLFFSFGGQNYARYLTVFSIFIANTEQSHPGALELLQNGAISVARSFIPDNRCSVDKTIEETFMKHAKSHGGAGGSGAGLSEILSNYPSYQRWVRTTHERSNYLRATFDMADMWSGTDHGSSHRDLRPAEVKRS